MKIPRYWAAQTASARDPQGHVYYLKRWGHSETSQSEAQRHAVEKLRQTVEHITRHGPNQHSYTNDYTNGVRREELIETIQNADQTTIGAITRNRYGSLVLNTTQLLIADVDQHSPGLFAFFKGLFFGRNHRASAPLARIEHFQRNHPEYALRIYRTHSGYRVLIVNHAFAPNDAVTRHLFTELGCDPLYARLCRSQDSFRARLTPKPWRCHCPQPPNGFPRETSAAQTIFNQWLSNYQQQCRTYAVCERLDQQDVSVSAGVARLLKIHDDHVLRAGYPLA